MIMRKSTRCYGCSARKMNTGRPAWNKGLAPTWPSYWLGKKMSDEQRARLSQACKGRVGYFKGKKRPEISGEKSHYWKGGVTPKNLAIRNSMEMKQWRKAVFERDDYTCQDCGQRGGDLQADHIKPFSLFPELRFEKSNGRTLCVPCHKQTDTYAGRIYQLSK